MLVKALSYLWHSLAAPDAYISHSGTNISGISDIQEMSVRKALVLLEKDGVIDDRVGYAFPHYTETHGLFIGEPLKLSELLERDMISEDARVVVVTHRNHGETLRTLCLGTRKEFADQIRQVTKDMDSYDRQFPGWRAMRTIFPVAPQFRV